MFIVFATFGAGLVPEQTSQVAKDRTAQGQTAAQGGRPGNNILHL